MSAKQRAAVDRVRTFVAARQRFHASRRRAEAYGGPKNPVPDRIIGEYGHLDVNDLLLICDATEAL